jgi:hypothetical protein
VFVRGGLAHGAWPPLRPALAQSVANSARPEGRTPQGPRTGKFVLIADCPVDNSGGNHNRLPLPMGSDQRPVGRIEFASFAMLATPWRRSGPDVYATRLGVVAIFRVGAP